MSKPFKVTKFKVALAISSFAAASLFVVASAVSLGVTSNNQLAAGTSVTAACQPSGASQDIVVGFDTPTYVPATKKFNVGAVKLTNVAVACNTKKVQVVVANAAGASIGAYTGTISGTSLSATLPASVDSEAVASVSVVIYDN